VAPSLSHDVVTRYHREGYVFPLRAIAPGTAAELAGRLDAFEAEHGRPLAEVHRLKLHLLFTWLDDLVRHPAILDAVESILGPDLLCWNTTLFWKRPGSASYVSWHQDATYWGLSHPDVLTAWVALTDSDPDNGNMRVIPASHARALAHADTFARDNMLSRGQEIAVEVDEAAAVDIALRPGEFSLHHVMLVHGSRPNASGRPRIGCAIRYLSTCVRQVAGPRDSAMLVRGEDRFGHFDLEPRPPRDLDPAMLAYHGEVCARQTQILYRGARG
jgi:hypothetical protein